MKRNVNGALQLLLWGGIDGVAESGAPCGQSDGGEGAASDAAGKAAIAAGPRPRDPGESGHARGGRSPDESKAGKGVVTP